MIPNYDKLMFPALKALKALGGSGSNSEILEKVIELEGYPEEVQNEKHNDGPMSELEYRLAWAKTYLKKYGAMENSERGIWSITDSGEHLENDHMSDVVTKVRRMTTQSKKEKRVIETLKEEGSSEENLEEWKTLLLNILQNKISPKAFEKLSQRILRESGFVEVEVTGKAGDGGIDGYGVLKINLLSFIVIFQCKRYKETVGPNYIRDFRGAMQGRAEKGLFITTGSFTSAAKKEAHRDGAPPIDLIDGDELCDLLKRLKLGVTTETRELVTVDEGWFEGM